MFSSEIFDGTLHVSFPAITSSHSIDKPLTLATAPVRNKNVLSGISPPTMVDASVMMTRIAGAGLTQRGCDGAGL